MTNLLIAIYLPFTYREKPPGLHHGGFLISRIKGEAARLPLPVDTVT